MMNDGTSTSLALSISIWGWNTAENNCGKLCYRLIEMISQLRVIGEARQKMTASKDKLERVLAAALAWDGEDDAELLQLHRSHMPS